MPQRDHNPSGRRLHLPIVGVTNGPGAEAVGVNARGERKPPWLKVRLQTGPNYGELREIMRGRDLHTVCEEAMCPNIHECWEEREATFLILGSKCTRRCGFCDVMTARPDPVDEDEPGRIADAVLAMGLRYVVLTGVARDDLADGGARVWAASIRAVRHRVPGCGVEILPSDFKGGEADIATVLDAEPDVFAHNLETVRRLHDRIRPAFGYDRSVDVVRFAKRLHPNMVTKSNLILGMGERPDEIGPAMRDLVDAGCDILTMGQYLQPTAKHLPVDRWVHPDEFAEHARAGEALGFAHVEAGPLVRSSYHAGKQYQRAIDHGRNPAPSDDETRWRSRPVSRILCADRGPPATICLGGTRRSASAADPFSGPVRPTRQLGRAVLERCLLGLAPGGGCQPRRSPAALVRSYRTVSPLPGRLAPPGRSALCCPVREVTPAWLSPAPCPVESGLSSNDPKTARGRPAGSSAGEDTLPHRCRGRGIP